MSIKKVHPKESPRGESKVQQHQTDSNSIKDLEARHLQNNMPQMNPKIPQYLDLSSGLSHHEMLNKVTETNQAFMNLNPHIRKKFHNQPQELIDFCKNEQNLEEAEALGLVPKGTFVPPQKEPEAPKPPSTPKEADKTKVVKKD